MHESPDHETTFGYLSAIHAPEHGWFGGYLIVSTLGRPLEFHCTAPVLPSRAQQILYGPTLSSYLIGEQIGGSLVAAARLTPRLFLTDRAEFDALASQCKIPMVLVVEAERETAGSATTSEESAGKGAASSGAAMAAQAARRTWLEPFRACSHIVQLPPDYESQRQHIVAWLELLADRVYLSEPFGRIHEAIREAQRIDARGHESHGQAA
jgi:hypothetical protein